MCGAGGKKVKGLDILLHALTSQRPIRRTYDF